MKRPEESGGTLDPETDAKRNEAAAYLAELNQRGLDSAVVRTHFDEGRYAQAILEASATLGESLEHDPEELRELAGEAFGEAATLAELEEHRRWLDEEA